MSERKSRFFACLAAFIVISVVMFSCPVGAQATDAVPADDLAQETALDSTSEGEGTGIQTDDELVVLDKTPSGQHVNESEPAADEGESEDEGHTDGVASEEATDQVLEPTATEGAYIEDAAASDVNPEATTGASEQVPQQPDPEQAPTEQLVADGAYIIKTSVGSNFVLDTVGTKNVVKANVVEATYTGGAAQAWQIAYNAARGFYQIFRTAADGTRLSLDVAGGRVASGTNVHLWESNDTDAQLWNIVAYGSGYRIISALGDTLALDVRGAKAADGTNVQIYTDNKSTAQRFGLFSTKPEVSGTQVVQDGTYEIVSTVPGGTRNVADIDGGSLSNGANAQIYAGNGSIAQRFHFAYNAAGYYDVVAVGSGCALDAWKASLLPGTNVRQYESNGTKAQQWVVLKNSNATYTLLNRASGLALDISGGSTKNGANLQLYTSNGTAAQQFKLHAVDMLPAGLYTICALSASKQVVDIKGASTSSGATVQMYASNGSLAQKFELKKVSANEYRIRTASSGGWLTAGASGATVTQQGNHATAVTGANTWRAEWVGGHIVLVNKANGAALTMTGGKTSNGTKLTTSTTSGNASQRFAFKSTHLLEAGCFFVANCKGPYLTIEDSSASAGANVELYAKGTALGQYFYLERSGSAYRLKNAYSGKYVAATGTASKSNVVQQSSSSSNNQRWYARIADGGGVTFENVGASGKVLDVLGGKTTNGTNVQIYSVNNSSAQAWKLIKTTYTPYPEYVLKAIRKANASYSSTKYLIVVDRDHTHVIVMSGGNGNWKPYKIIKCTVGAPSTPTVTGSFSVGSRGYSFGSGFTCYYWTQFYSDYLFHSVLYREGTRTVMDGRLGIHASHGCVRMAIENAKWIYSNVPSGTRVLIY